MEGPPATQQKELIRRVGEHLSILYPSLSNEALSRQLITEIEIDQNIRQPQPHHNHWDETDCILITYANSIKRNGEKPLHTLHRFLGKHLSGIIEAVHILPFFPFSSDDGFAIMD